MFNLYRLTQTHTAVMESYCEAECYGIFCFYFEGTVRFCVAVLFTMNLGSVLFLEIFNDPNLKVSLLGNTYSLL